MAKGFGPIGHCARCGDTQGPWSLYEGIGWLCDVCAEEEDESNNKDKKEEDDDERGIT